MTANTVQPLPPLGVRGLARAALRRTAVRGRVDGDLTRSFDASRLEMSHVERYNRELGFVSNRVPLTYFYLLIQRAEFATLLSPQFGFRLPGMVHVENQLHLEGTLDVDAPLLLRTAVTLEPPTERGAIYARSIVNVLQGGRKIVGCCNRYVARRGEAAKSVKEEGKPQPWPELASWTLPKTAGTAYASLSGDWNPIHLWPWSARLLGLREPIIHGMHSIGRACAEIERRSGGRVTAVQSRFRRPIAVGSSVRLAAETTGSTPAHFEITSAGTITVTGHTICSSQTR